MTSNKVIIPSKTCRNIFFQLCHKPHGSLLCSLLIFPSLTFTFLRLFGFWGYVWILSHISVSLPPDMLADIQQLAFTLLQTQPVTVCLVMAFLGNANFCANGYSKLWALCCDIQSDILTVDHSPAHLFSPLYFSFSALHQLEQLSHLQHIPVPLQFPLPDVVIATDAMPTH